MKEDVLRLQVVVDNFVLQLMQVPDGRRHLPNYQFGLSLRYFLMFLQVVTQIRTITILQHCAEGIAVDFNSIVRADDVGVG